MKMSSLLPCVKKNDCHSIQQVFDRKKLLHQGQTPWTLASGCPVSAVPCLCFCFQSTTRRQGPWRLVPWLHTRRHGPWRLGPCTNFCTYFTQEDSTYIIIWQVHRTQKIAHFTELSPRQVHAYKRQQVHRFFITTNSCIHKTPSAYIRHQIQDNLKSFYHNTKFMHTNAT